MAATTAKPVKSAGKIPGSTLKIIAMVCMLIDHTAAVLFDRILISRGLLDAVNASDGGASFLSTGNTAVIYYADMIMRAIGRISFPIFCFLLIEGFMHTHDVKKYALNLGIFALVSEIPFDLAFAGKPFYLDYQNVFFTLFIGLVMMIFLQNRFKSAKRCRCMAEGELEGFGWQAAGDCGSLCSGHAVEDRLQCNGNSDDCADV